MIVCPVCENRQARGTECEVCGKVFSLSVVRAAGHAVEAAPLEGLEPTRYETPGAPVAPVADDAPCVWCRHVQKGGKFCERCGMERHRGRARSDEQVPGHLLPEGWARCGECGLPTPPPRCRGCGARVAWPDEDEALQ
ncbi:MAG: hypothetical protein D6729_00450 [Deltaproteobacteria bacterium]|nr:MAG: hypothetical protein D6729_00450 [Deltaproteobacteria bacterium]